MNQSLKRKYLDLQYGMVIDMVLIDRMYMSDGSVRIAEQNIGFTILIMNLLLFVTKEDAKSEESEMAQCGNVTKLHLLKWFIQRKNL